MGVNKLLALWISLKEIKRFTSGIQDLIALAEADKRDCLVQFNLELNTTNFTPYFLQGGPFYDSALRFRSSYLA